jgi:serine protease inhibitor
MSLSPCFPAAIVMATSAPAPPKEFIANHPFVFVIQNLELQVVLFAGRFSRV